MKAVYLFIFVLLIMFTGCEPAYQITKKNVGTNQNETIYTSSKIKMQGDRSYDAETVYIEYYCSKSDSGTVYSFIIETIGSQWLDIQNLKLDIEGMETEHNYNRPPIVDARDVRGINETVNFTINKNKIIDIIEIRECKLIIVGATREVEIDMRENWIEKLEQFYEETLK